jgi:hypothetical protein
MNLMKKMGLGLFLATSFSMSASADVIQNVQEEFASGAVFNGNVTFTDSYDQVIGVDGYLTGATYGNDYINWIWNTGLNFSGGSQTGGNFLMDGTPGSYSHWISFTWDYSNAPNLTFSSVGYGNNVDYGDPATNGTISQVPEPASVALLGLGLFCFAASRRKSAKRDA